MATGEPVYAYLFDHPYPGPEVDQYGTFHTAEVPYVFGVLEQSGRVFSKADQQISDQLQEYWINKLRQSERAGLEALEQSADAGSKSDGIGGLKLGLGWPYRRYNA